MQKVIVWKSTKGSTIAPTGNRTRTDQLAEADGGPDLVELLNQDGPALWPKADHASRA